MRLVLVGPAHPYRGGIAQYNTALYKALALEHDVLLVSFSRQYPDFLFPGRTQKDESGRPFQVPYEPILDSLVPSSWRSAGRRIAEFNADCVLFQWWQPFFAMAYSGTIRAIRRTADVPVLFLCHNVLSHEQKPIPGRRSCEKFMTRRVFQNVDGFLVHSEGLIQEVQKFCSNGLVRKIFHPLYDFYSEWDECSERRNCKHAGPNRPHLLFFGKIREYKGFWTFLEALGKLRERLDFEATVAGEFYVDPRPYRKRASRLGLDSHLIWKDHYIPNEAVPKLFRSADLVVLPYVEATQSGVVPLAYQFEVPVVATDVGGLSEVVLEGKTGYLVPPRSPEALAEKILQFFQQQNKEEFQSNIVEFRSRLSWKQVIDNLGALLSELQKSVK